MARMVDLTQQWKPGREKRPVAEHDWTHYRDMYRKYERLTFTGAPARCDGITVRGASQLVTDLTFRQGIFWCYLAPGEESNEELPKIVGRAGTGTWVFKGPFAFSVIASLRKLQLWLEPCSLQFKKGRRL